MVTTKEKEEIFNHWNNKNIIQHRRITTEISKAISKILSDYSVLEIKELIDFYATILEPGVPETQKMYFWSYKWNLYEFLTRGVKKFDGQTTTNFLKNKPVQQDAIVFTQNNNK